MLDGIFRILFHVLSELNYMNELVTQGPVRSLFYKWM